MKTIQVCKYCGSPRVFCDAYVNLNDASDVRTFDDARCMDCDCNSSYLTRVVEVPDNFDIDEDSFDFEELK